MVERRPILFCCTHSAGEANTSIALAGELARRGVPDLWFASDENNRAAVEAPADRSEVEFVSLGEVNPRLALTMLDEQTYNKVMQPSRTKSVQARICQLSDADHHFARYRKLDELVTKVEPAVMVVNRFCMYAIQVAIARDIPYVISAPCLPSSLLEYALPKDYPTPSSGLPLRMSWSQRMTNWYFRTFMKFIFLNRTILKQAMEFNKHMVELKMDVDNTRVRVQHEKAGMLLCFSVFGLDYPFPVPEELRTLGSPFRGGA